MHNSCLTKMSLRTLKHGSDDIVDGFTARIHNIWSWLPVNPGNLRFSLAICRRQRIWLKPRCGVIYAVKPLTKGHNIVKMTGNNPNLEGGNINEYIYKNLVKFHPFVFNILSGYENVISTKGHDFAMNFRKMIVNNLNLDLVNINAHTKFGQILSISSQGIERKRKSDINQGP